VKIKTVKETWLVEHHRECVVSVPDDWDEGEIITYVYDSDKLPDSEVGKESDSVVEIEDTPDAKPTIFVEAEDND
jgi:hypothetical protein